MGPIRPMSPANPMNPANLIPENNFSIRFAFEINVNHRSGNIVIILEGCH